MKASKLWCALSAKLAAEEPQLGQWSRWRRFPDPRLGGVLVAPIGMGIYELRLHDSSEMLLFEPHGKLAYRMTALLPPPLGKGYPHNNIVLRDFILTHIEQIEYRTIAFEDIQKLIQFARKLKSEVYYKFWVWNPNYSAKNRT